MRSAICVYLMSESIWSLRVRRCKSEQGHGLLNLNLFHDAHEAALFMAILHCGCYIVRLAIAFTLVVCSLRDGLYLGADKIKSETFYN